jgi:putative oxidoreductase
MSKGKTITLWIVSGLVAALFLFAGGFKLLKPEMAKTGFVQMGYAAWFAIFIGICEVLGGIGVLIPRVAGLAAACLSIIMVGAVYTVVSHHLYSDAVVPAITFFLLIFISYTRFTSGRALQAQATAPGR